MYEHKCITNVKLFFLLTLDKPDKGLIHKSRQWDLIITPTDINDDSCRIPVQVVAEVTGSSR